MQKSEIAPLVKLNISRFDQVVLGNKMKDLISSNFTQKFVVNYQGSPQGPIATMVIVGFNVPFVKELKTYLWNKFRTGNDKINGHGSIETTIVIQLSELSQGSKTMIEVEHLKLFPSNINIKNLSAITNRRDKVILPAPLIEVKEPIKLEEIVVPLVEVKEPIKLERGRKSVSQTLSSVFSFENQTANPSFVGYILLKNYFEYDPKMENQYTVLNCRTEEISLTIEKALIWFMGNEKLVCNLGNKVLVDLSKIKERKERPAGLLFCLQPNSHSSQPEIEARLRRVCQGTIPTVKKLTDNSFKVSYPKKGSATRIYGYIKEMGWFTVLDSEKELTIYLEDPKLIVSFENNDLVEKAKTEPALEEVKEISFLARSEDPLETESVIPEFVHTVVSPEEAIFELNNIYLDHKLFQALSSETQQRIVSVLEKSWREHHVEEYAKKLLSLLNI